MTVLAAVRTTECRITAVTVAGVEYLAARFDLDVLTQGAIQLGSIMDAIAAKVPDTATSRVYAWPVETIQPPCAVVAYPEEPIQFDATFTRGSDRATFPLFFLVGKATERTARDRLSEIVTGATGIKDAMDGPLESEEE